jgi:hypothetical protein
MLRWNISQQGRVCLNQVRPYKRAFDLLIGIFENFDFAANR